MEIDVHNSDALHWKLTAFRLVGRLLSAIIDGNIVYPKWALNKASQSIGAIHDNYRELFEEIIISGYFVKEIPYEDALDDSSLLKAKELMKFVVERIEHFEHLQIFP